VHVESHILIVDDDLQIRKLLGRYLAAQGFRVTLASDKRTLEAALESNDIKLIVLDVMLPDGSGLEICRDMRAENSNVPIILLTALKEDVDRIIGLEIGADDYLGKPFNPRELTARIRAVLRRQNDAGQIAHSPQEYRFEGFNRDCGGLLTRAAGCWT
jgi:two-component system, OmpR family, response regulator